jgi:hypothetical protein
MPEHSYTGRADQFDALLEAAKARSDADEALTALLRDPVRDGREKISIVLALGESQGPVGSAAIREQFAEAMAKLPTARPHQRSWVRDLAGAAVYALRERDGPAAEDIFVTAAFHPNRRISSQGLNALERAGDGRAWDEVLFSLGEILGKKVSGGTLRGDQALTAIGYLARHAQPASDRAIRLVTLVRDRWSVLGIQLSVERRWPDMGPGGPAPEAVSLTPESVRHYHPISDDTRLG